MFSLVGYIPSSKLVIMGYLKPYAQNNNNNNNKSTIKQTKNKKKKEKKKNQLFPCSPVIFPLQSFMLFI
jgi:hypothetical protein